MDEQLNTQIMKMGTLLNAALLKQDLYNVPGLSCLPCGRARAGVAEMAAAHLLPQLVLGGEVAVVLDIKNRK